MNYKPLSYFFFISVFILVQCKTPETKKEAPQTIFTDVAREENVISKHIPLKDIQRVSSGAAWLDADNDGDLDIYVTSVDGPNQLFRNNRIGTDEANFTEITNGDALAMGTYSAGVAVADYDNDGDNDIYITSLNEDVLLQNDGKGNFKDVTQIAFQTDKQFLFEFGASASWGDINNDGWLDLYVANNAPNNQTTIYSRDYLFVNNGGDPVTFTNRIDMLAGDYDKDGIEDRDAIGFLGLFTDYNLDGHLDIYLANDCPFGPEDNKLWHNNGDMTFREVSDSVGPFTRGKFIGGRAVNDCHNAMGITCGDPNHDGWPDYHFTNVHYVQQNTVLLQNTGKYLLNVSAEAGLDQVDFNSRIGILFTWGTVFIDYDLDTWQDLTMSTGSIFGKNDQPNMLFHNEGTDIGGYPNFRKVNNDHSGIANLGQSRTIIQGDYDMDGDPDLFLVNFDSLACLYRNNNNNGNNWLIVEAKGAGPPLTNRNGIGAKVYVTTPDNLRQFQEIRSGSSLGGGDDIAAYFGLGNQKTCELEIIWPSGIRQHIEKIQANQRIEIDEPETALIFPGGGEFLTIGNSYEIKWKSVYDGKIQVILKGQIFEDIVIARDFESTGNYAWTVSDEIPEGQGYNLLIYDNEGLRMLGKTNTSFSVIPSNSAFCKITSPNGRELLERGKVHKITWETNKNEEDVDIVLLNGSDVERAIVDKTKNDGVFEWKVPETLEGNNFKIEIISHSGLKDESDGTFSIIKKLIEPALPKNQRPSKTGD